MAVHLGVAFLTYSSSTAHATYIIRVQDICSRFQQEGTLKMNERFWIKEDGRSYKWRHLQYVKTPTKYEWNFREIFSEFNDFKDSISAKLKVFCDKNNLHLHFNDDFLFSSNELKTE